MAENGLQPQLRGFGVDVGGSGIKGALVDLNTGQLIGERIRIATPQPATPDQLQTSSLRLPTALAGRVLLA